LTSSKSSLQYNPTLANSFFRRVLSSNTFSSLTMKDKYGFGFSARSQARI
jgi:hypothetical protein